MQRNIKASHHARSPYAVSYMSADTLEIQKVSKFVTQDSTWEQNYVYEGSTTLTHKQNAIINTCIYVEIVALLHASSPGHIPSIN